MAYDLFVQAIGGLGVLCFVISYQIKSTRILFFFQMLANCLFAAQFILLHAYTGCINLLLMVTRNFLMMNYDNWEWVRKIKWHYGLIALSAISMILTYDGWISILPFIAMAGGTLFYVTNNAQKIRLANLICCCPSWIIYDFFVHSWTGMLNESIMICSILVSIYRYGWKEMNQEDFGKSANM